MKLTIRIRIWVIRTIIDFEDTHKKKIYVCNLYVYDPFFIALNETVLSEISLKLSKPNMKLFDVRDVILL